MPLLFIVYINDLPDCLPPEVNCSMYADDVKIFSPNDAAALQAGLDAVFNWSRRWKLEVSLSKTKILCLGTPLLDRPIFSSVG